MPSQTGTGLEVLPVLVQTQIQLSLKSSTEIYQIVYVFFHHL